MTSGVKMLAILHVKGSTLAIVVKGLWSRVMGLSLGLWGKGLGFKV